MSYYTENQKMKPVLDKARELDIATNPTSEALFDAGQAGFQIWCTPDDHPAGWENIPMTPGAFSKPCEYVASVHWGWEGETITYLVLSTEAFALSELRDRTWYTGHNRPEDLAWAKQKIHWLFAQAEVPLLPIKTDVP